MFIGLKKKGWGLVSPLESLRNEQHLCVYPMRCVVEMDFKIMSKILEKRLPFGNNSELINFFT